jgi:mannobiose 2-epimerase
VGPRDGPARLTHDTAPAALHGVAERYRRHLEDTVLAFWAGAVDQEAGGFHTDLDARGRPRGRQDRSIVHVARLLWAFSAAHRAVGREGRWLPFAHRAAASLDRFWDRTEERWMEAADRRWRPRETHRTLYGHAFAVFALAEYAAVTGSEVAHRRAARTMELLAEGGRASHGGFPARWTAQGGPLPDPAPDPNAHLHLMEALIPLWRLTGDPGHRELLRNMRDLVVDRLIVPATGGGARLAGRPDREPAESFGHGIETAWLLLEATEALGEAPGGVLPTCRALAARVAERGIGSGGGVDMGIRARGRKDRRRVWWVQSEALVGFLRLFTVTGEERFASAFASVDGWVMRRQADHRHGEWFAELGPRGLVRDGRKSYRWKSAYHTTRACLEVVRLAEEAFAPEANGP